MMKRFAITSARFKGEITYTFNDQGFLQSFVNNADLTEEQTKFILKYLPLTIDEVEEMLKKPSLNLQEIPFKVTFEMFWDRYNDKSRSSRKKSLKVWEKFDESNQAKAYLFYPIYNRQRGNAEKKYCETYLAAELWNN